MNNVRRRIQRFNIFVKSKVLNVKENDVTSTAYSRGVLKEAPTRSNVRMRKRSKHCATLVQILLSVVSISTFNNEIDGTLFAADPLPWDRDTIKTACLFPLDAQSPNALVSTFESSTMMWKIDRLQGTISVKTKIEVQTGSTNLGKPNSDIEVRQPSSSAFVYRSRACFDRLPFPCFDKIEVSELQSRVYVCLQERQPFALDDLATDDLSNASHVVYQTFVLAFAPQAEGRLVWKLNVSELLARADQTNVTDKSNFKASASREIKIGPLRLQPDDTIVFSVQAFDPDDNKQISIGLCRIDAATGVVRTIESNKELSGLNE